MSNRHAIMQRVRNRDNHSTVAQSYRERNDGHELRVTHAQSPGYIYTGLLISFIGILAGGVAFYTMIVQLYKD